MKTLTEQYQDLKKQEAVISKKARDFVGGMVKEGYNVGQMEIAIKQAEYYVEIGAKRAFIEEPKKLYCSFGGHLEIDEEGEIKR